MATIDTIIEVNVALAAAGASAPSFSIPLIIGGTNAGWSDYVHGYTSPASMLTDGFNTSSPEYVYALELYAQSRQVSEFFVGHRTTPVTQVDTVVVNSLTGVPGHIYSFTLNGVLISYTSQVSDSYGNILSGLEAAVTTAFPSSPFVAPPVTMAITGSGSGTTLTLTSAFPGQGVSYTLVDSELTQANVTPNNGIATDLTNITGENSSWYAIALCSNADNDIVQLSAAVEATKKIFLAVSNDAAIATSSTTDILSYLKGKALTRTALIYSPGSYNLGIEAAWMGNFLPLTPGSYNPAYMTLDGIEADTAITDSQRLTVVGNPVAQVPGKNGNVYTTVLGLDITQFGQMVGGRFLDITIGLDWLTANIQVAVLNAIYAASQAGQKIPYTDNGTAVFIQAVSGVIQQGVVNGLINGANKISITAPLVASVSSAQRQNRLAPPISFTCTLQGAFNAATVSGVVLI
jgi:hypothetical protein